MYCVFGTNCIHLKAVEDAGLQRRWLVVTEALMQMLNEVLNCEPETCVDWILSKCIVQGRYFTPLQWDCCGVNNTCLGEM